MYAEERRSAMAQRISAQGRISVAALATDFDVTTETVRRDLSTLERQGVVRRVHGGAVPAATLRVIESGVADRSRTRTDDKDAIARHALRHLPQPGSTVLLDAGTTTAALASALPAQHPLTVITHSVPIAARLAGLAQVELHLLPGRVRPTTLAAVGPDAVAALASLRVDVAFVGTNGVSADHGLSTPDSEEASVKRAIIAAARSVVVLADASKIGEEHTRSFGRAEDVDVLVTSPGADDDALAALTAAGWEVEVA
ncbi:DeoR/GlpR family DNA-binding transcription regulator [Nocardioides zeae]|uniref:Lactose phosphotransferase system repressor n=1 Tax=Nocardioides imazamoxiresistens TaxID=3231893 RepID=A0ABU3PX69_9ACTN|nr:DeoR/GlpR family DNA-binding transcription regulator [Nocardioides zeae]MDT9593837.1 DeoR/GlpR family DNA-binding transcription regulator [Nocardioides zeae]